MRYVRTFRIQASHFNLARTYEIAWRLDVEAPMRVPSVAQIIEMLKDSHGHNFKIEVAVIGEMDEQGWLIDDIVLAAVVNEWNNTNLSMHGDFFSVKDRATTENMAQRLRVKLKNKFDTEAVRIGTVRVYETEDIYAEA